MQLEFVMLDAYVRKTLTPPSTASSKGLYSTTFTVPDVYGIYHFRVMYRRPALSLIYLREQVSVRPFLHNEYERFILSAYPYYSSAFSMMAGVFVFALLFLYAKPTQSKGSAGAAKSSSAAGEAEAASASTTGRSYAAAAAAGVTKRTAAGEQ